MVAAVLLNIRGFVVVFFTFWGCCRLFWSRFGHDKAKNDSGIDFPYPSYESLVCCVYEVDGLRTMLEWDEALVCFISLVCLGTTQIELEGWLSSPQPMNSTGREVRA